MRGGPLALWCGHHRQGVVVNESRWRGNMAKKMIFRHTLHILFDEDDLTLCGLPNEEMNQGKVKVTGMKEEEVACNSCTRLIVEDRERLIEDRDALAKTCDEWVAKGAKVIRSLLDLWDQEAQSTEAEDDEQTGDDE